MQIMPSCKRYVSQVVATVILYHFDVCGQSGVGWGPDKEISLRVPDIPQVLAWRRPGNLISTTK